MNIFFFYNFYKDLLRNVSVYFLLSMLTKTVSLNIQNIFFCVPQKKASHTFLGELYLIVMNLMLQIKIQSITIIMRSH